MSAIMRADGDTQCGICYHPLTPNVYNPSVTHEGAFPDHTKFHFSCMEKRAIEQINSGSSLTCPIDQESLRMRSRNSLLSRGKLLKLATTTAAYTALLSLTTSLLGMASAKIASAIFANEESPLVPILAFAQLGTGLELIGAEIKAPPGCATLLSTLFCSLAARWTAEKLAITSFWLAPLITTLTIGGACGILATRMLTKRAVPLNDRNLICCGVLSGMFLSTATDLIPSALELWGITLPTITAAVALPAIALFGSAVAFYKSYAERSLFS